MAMPAYTPALFRDRPRHMQVLAGGIVPAALGAVAGILLGISAGAYWAISLLAAVGGFLAGFEHRDGWGGADRGLIGGAIYGLFILLAHWAAGTHAKVSLGSFPPLLILITAIIAILLGAVGGRLARAQRERAGTAPPATHTS
jgi:apolipoprotein N-acyltransferase